MGHVESLYPHNRIVYDLVMEELKVNKMIGIVQATGTGKGKLAAAVIETLHRQNSDAKVLILASLRSILSNYRANFGLMNKNIKYSTYYNLLSYSQETLNNVGLHYDLIVLDEFHRLGAEKWGGAVNNIIQGVKDINSHCRVIGMTATPIRYLDHRRNMGDELFEGRVIQGLTLEEAIVDGILPPFEYTACYFQAEEELARIKKKIANNGYNITDDMTRNDLIGSINQLSMSYKNRLSIENIIKNGTKELGPNQKWVIFCKGVSEQVEDNIEQIRKYCVNWFNYEPNIFVIASTKGRTSDDNDRVLDDFRNAKQGVNVCLCVNMLNEGVHIKDLNGVIMMRKTESPTIFLQQLGRALEAGKDFSPKIFDLVGNYRDLKVDEPEIDISPVRIVKKIAETTEKKGHKKYVIVHNYMEEMDNVLSRLSDLEQYRPWTDKEKDILIEFYPIGGSKLCQEKGLNRLTNIIIAQAHRMGLKTENYESYNNYYTEEEKEILKEFFPIGGYKLCIEKGLNRSPKSIMRMAYGMGLKGLKTLHGLTEEEDYIVRTYYPIGGAKLCQEKGLNKNYRAIVTLANNMGIVKSQRYRSWKDSWSDKDVEILTVYYPKGGVQLCQEKGLDKKEEEIRRIAYILGIRKENPSLNFSEEEKEIIIKYYPLGGSKLCQLKGVKRTGSSLVSYANENGIKKDVNHLFIQEEIDIILRFYPLGGAKLCQEKGLFYRAKKKINECAMQLGL